MKKMFLLFGILFVIAVGIFFAQNYFRTSDLMPFKKAPIIAINGQKFTLTIADSDKEREVGLSETSSLPQNRGMLFLFDKPDYYSFWMRNMKIPIDIIYLNKDSIVTVLKNVQPPKNPTESPIIYTPQEPSDKVLEINAGLSDKYNFKRGDKFTLENL